MAHAESSRLQRSLNPADSEVLRPLPFHCIFKCPGSHPLTVSGQVIREVSSLPLMSPRGTLGPSLTAGGEAQSDTTDSKRDPSPGDAGLLMAL